MPGELTDQPEPPPLSVGSTESSGDPGCYEPGGIGKRRDSAEESYPTMNRYDLFQALLSRLPVPSNFPGKLSSQTWVFPGLSAQVRKNPFGCVNVCFEREGKGVRMKSRDY